MKRDLIAALPIFLLAMFTEVASAQQPVIQGLIYSKQSSTAIANVSVVNTTANLTARSNDRGVFKISCSIGDTLRFSKSGYIEIKRAVLDGKDLVVYMDQIRVLDEIVVKGEKMEDQLREISEGYRAKGIYYNGKPPAALLSPFGGSPLTFFYELLGRDGKHARAFANFTERELEQNQIDRRFNAHIIQQLVPLGDTDLPDFKSRYKPTLLQIQAWNDVDLYVYIKKSYDAYLKLKIRLIK